MERIALGFGKEVYREGYGDERDDGFNKVTEDPILD
jgi:hypothetical protein